MKETIFFVVMLAANAIQAITGFAGTLLAMPPAMLLIGVTPAKVVLNFAAAASGLWIGIQNRRFICWRELFKICGGMLIGMAAGMLLFQLFPLRPLKIVYAIFIVAIALRSLLVKKQAALPRPVLLILLLLAGVIHGMFVSGGSLLVVYAAQVFKDKDSFRATLGPVWVVLNSIMMIEQGCMGQCTPQTLLLCAVTLLPVAVGTLIGNRLHGKISQQGFLRLTYLLLLASGALLLI